MQQLFIGADHRGFKLKEQLKKWLLKKKYPFKDCGNTKYDPHDDYPDFAKNVSSEIQKAGGEDALGILICGSGIGVCIVANKHKNIRCGVGVSPLQIAHGRSADNINVLALSSDFLSFEEATIIVEAFLNTPFTYEERHVRRLEKIEGVL